MMGALVEVDNVGTSGEYLRGRIVDPTGAFNVYAGQYQPEALQSLSNLTVPCFVAVVGKTSAYKPDEETTIVSIRPETIVEVDAKTRDYWVKETVAKTLERVERSQMPEAEKEKYRQICKDALTKLVYMTQEISIPLHEAQEVPTPHQEENNPTNPTIEEPAKKTLGIEEDTAIEAIKRLMNEGRCYEPRVGYLHPVLNEEKLPETLPASASENHEDEEPKDKILLTSQEPSAEEHPRPGNKIPETLRSQERKDSKTTLNDSIKARIKKKKIERKPANNNQKTLFTESLVKDNQD